MYTDVLINALCTYKYCRLVKFLKNPTGILPRKESPVQYLESTHEDKVNY